MSVSSHGDTHRESARALSNNLSNRQSDPPHHQLICPAIGVWSRLEELRYCHCVISWANQCWSAYCSELDFTLLPTMSWMDRVGCGTCWGRLVVDSSQLTKLVIAIVAARQFADQSVPPFNVGPQLSNCLGVAVCHSISECAALLATGSCSMDTSLYITPRCQL